MENKTYLIMVIILIIIIVVFSSYKIISLQKEVKILREWQVTDKSCYDYFSNNENLIILDLDDQYNYCKEVLNIT